ncbi:hypothetical protein [Aurantiacibacter zhengii]|uniref:Uncharacterized protein n=1 Tax=Aurantiacibacter zhengii TaxID=2307003 RepID=A0A418NSI0_9SPHN|nr:hypothetical protein [Aurantiacibacter zhengii]RIV85927.1 hypothetical protein D2V07_11525 [Aurantiacibacter zhengii]
MSKVTLGVFIAAIALIVVAVALDSAVFAGGSGIILMVGLIYAFVVARRDAERGEVARPAGVNAAE